MSGLIDKIGLGFYTWFEDKGTQTGLKKIRGEVHLLERGIRNLGVGAHAIRSSLDRIGGTVAMASAAMTVAMGGMVSRAVDFDDAMRRALSPLGVAEFARSFDPLRAVAIDIAREFGVMPVEVAKGMEDAIKAGLTGINQVSAVTRAAVQGHIADASVSVEDMTRLIVNISNATGRSMDDAKTVAETARSVYALASASPINLKDINETFKYAGSQLKAYKLDYYKLLAAIGVMGQSGIKGSLAGTAIESMVKGLSSSTSLRAQSALGIKVTDDNGRLKDYLNIAKEVYNQVKATTSDQQQQVALMGKLVKERGTRAVITLAQDGGKAFEDMEAAIQNSNGALEEAVQIIRGGYKGGLDVIKATLDGIAIRIFDRFGGGAQSGLANVNKWTGDLLKAFEALSTGASTAGLSESAVNFANGIDRAITYAKEAFAWIREKIPQAVAEFDKMFGPEAREKVLKFAAGFMILSPVLGPLLLIFSQVVGIGFSAITAFTGVMQAAFGLTQIIMGAGGLTKALQGLTVVGPLAVGALVIGAIVYADWDNMKGLIANVWEGLKDFSSGIYSTVKPAVEALGEAARGVGKAFTWFAEEVLGRLISGAFDKTGADMRTMGEIAASVAIGFAAAWVVAAHPIYALIAAIGYVIAKWEEFKQSVEDVVNAPTNALKAVMKAMLPKDQYETVFGRADAAGKGSGGLIWDHFSSNHEKGGMKLNQPMMGSGMPRGSVPPPKPVPSPAQGPTVGGGPEMGPPREAPKFIVNLDGRKVGHGVAKGQLALNERAGAKASPWQRRAVIERGIIPARVQFS